MLNCDGTIPEELLLRSVLDQGYEPSDCESEDSMSESINEQRLNAAEF